MQRWKLLLPPPLLLKACSWGRGSESENFGEAGAGKDAAAAKYAVAVAAAAAAACEAKCAAAAAKAPARKPAKSLPHLHPSCLKKKSAKKERIAFLFLFSDGF